MIQQLAHTRESPKNWNTAETLLPRITTTIPIEEKVSSVVARKGAELELLSFEPARARNLDLLFLHGMWGQASLFAAAAREAADKFNCASHCLSYQGIGNSTGGRQVTLDRLADNVTAAVEELRTRDRDVVLVGHSMGAAVVYRALAEGNNANIKAAVLLAPVPFAGIARAAWEFFQRHPVAFLKGNLDLHEVVATPELANEILYSHGIDREQLVALQRQGESTSHPAYLQLLIRPYGKVAPARVPLVVMRPICEQNYLAAAIRATAKVLGAEYRIVPGAHQGISEQPAEVVPSIMRWIDQKGLFNS